MIDTFKVMLTDYEISPNPDLSLILPSTDLSTGVSGGVSRLWETNGQAIEGTKAFHNGENFNVSIKPIANTGIIGCFVQFSAPKVLNGDNFTLADGLTTPKAVKQVEKHLREIGIKTNISTANVSRLDLAKNVVLIEPCSNYFPVLGTLKGSRVAKRDYGTTHTWANKSQEICAYDKLAEMQARKQATSGLPANSMRFEWRMLKSPKFQAATGMKTVKDVSSNYDHLTACYNETLKKQLFKFTVPQFNLLSTPQLEDEFKTFAGRGDACWWGVCMRAKAFQGMAAFDFDVMLNAALATAKHHNDVILQAPVNSDRYRKEISRIKRDFDKWRGDALSLPKPAAEQLTTAQLYSELQSKVLAA